MQLKLKTDNAVKADSSTGKFKVVAFEIEVEGHHPGYVQNFAKTWIDNNIPAALEIIVTPAFFELHKDTVKAVQNNSSNCVNIQSITVDEFENINKNPLLRYFRAWNLFCDYLERLNASHGLVMYLSLIHI